MHLGMKYVFLVVPSCVWIEQDSDNKFHSAVVVEL